jgi:hypothetical protein
LIVLTLVAAAQGSAQIKGLPASDLLGGEDVWQNPTFVTGVANGGETASSEW